MRITTPRLLLREYAADDLPALLAYHEDPRAREFHGPDEGHPEHLRRLLATFMAWAAERPRRNHQLALALREAPDALIGSCGLREAGLPAGCAELGVELAPAHRGRGYATEAVRALLAFGFSTRGLAGVRGVTVPANTRVTRLVERLGFRPVASGEASIPLAERGRPRSEWRLTREWWEAAREG